MSIEEVDPDGIETPEKALATINQIDFLLTSGDPKLQEQGRQRSWQKCHTLGLKTLQGAQERLQKEDPNLVASEMFAKAEKAWSWRYLIRFSSQDALYASFDAQLKVTGLSRGPKATVTVQAAQELRSLPESSGGKYTVRVLTIPGLLTEVFWLKRVSGKGPGDIVVPFFTSQHLRCGHPYSAGEFLELAAELATQRLSRKPTETRGSAKGKPQDLQTPPNNVAAQTAEDIKERLTEVTRRIMTEKRQKVKQEKDTSARTQSWQLAKGNISKVMASSPALTGATRREVPGPKPSKAKQSPRATTKNTAAADRSRSSKPKGSTKSSLS